MDDGRLGFLLAGNTRERAYFRFVVSCHFGGPESISECPGAAGLVRYAGVAEFGCGPGRGDWVEFKILGPLEVAVGSQRLELEGVRQQIVLAALLLGANNVVSMGRLQEAIYGEDLPPTSRLQVQISISSLRRVFAAHGHTAVIATRGPGYLIQVGAGQLDSWRFEDLVAAAGEARDAGHLDRAVASYRDALRLWRGPALDGMDSQLLQAAASRLDEQRIAAIEDRLALELDLGRQHELVGELTELVGQYPLRERLRGQLMVALYRCDRPAEALAVYRQARRTMIDELGIEPSERLQRLERAILIRDPALDPPTGPVRTGPLRQRVPSLLPAGIADFTGRAGQVEQIGRHLTDWGKGRFAAPVVVITGQGGVGKTSLAVHAARGVAGHFPDGQLFADLHAGAGHPVDPMRVLERFLRALGVPGPQVPEGLDERAEVYRDLLADRKVLVVLDDAAGESQISPLLPGGEAAAVLITSRHRLGGLAGAAHLEVGVLDAETSLELLGRIAGTARVRAEAGAAAAVAGQCGHLPLALRVAGARLAERPHWAIHQLADRLADETRRLDELRHGDLALRPSISLSYHSASEPARRLLRRLALVEAPVFSGWVAAALLDQPPAGAEDALDELVSARLAEIAGTGSGVHSRYRLHDLIRLYARERLAADEPAAEQAAALERALGALLYVAREADHRHAEFPETRMRSDATLWTLPGPLVEQLVSDPMAWFERERAALVSGIRQAAGAGLTDLCWGLAFTAATLFESRAYFDDWRETHQIALDAARRAGDVRGQATMLYTLGSLHMQQGHHAPAREELTAAEGLFQDTGDDQGIASVTAQLANLDRMSGRLDDAERRSQQALSIVRRTGDQAREASLLKNLARTKLELGQLDDALELLAEALRVAQATRNTQTESKVLAWFGEAYLLAAEPGRALGTFELALAKARDIGDPVCESDALRGVGVAKTRLGEFGPARSALQRALELAGTAGTPRQRILRGLGELALASGDPGQAVVLADQAAGASRDLGEPLEEVQALTLLSDAHAALGDSAAAGAASALAAALRANPPGDAPVA
jgi:DNA-binding SARP family transcriptional activator/tetratricopeptide (TPR) repeat protein